MKITFTINIQHGSWSTGGSFLLKEGRQAKWGEGIRGQEGAGQMV